MKMTDDTLCEPEMLATCFILRAINKYLVLAFMTLLQDTKLDLWGVFSTEEC